MQYIQGSILQQEHRQHVVTAELSCHRPDQEETPGSERSRGARARVGTQSKTGRNLGPFQVCPCKPAEAPAGRYPPWQGPGLFTLCLLSVLWQTHNPPIYFLLFCFLFCVKLVDPFCGQQAISVKSLGSQSCTQILDCVCGGGGWHPQPPAQFKAQVYLNSCPAVLINLCVSSITLFLVVASSAQKKKSLRK